ncbi:MAG: hypothetical protein GPJ54_12210 [Candidatus Heimdallarchaeota archaeon]|nr:hypothetical protein [Candidatus Heimdallarchaeota archaeon]
MNVLSNITTLFKKNTTETKNVNSNFYIVTSSIISVTIGLMAYALYRIGQLDLSNLKLPIL